MISTAIIFVLLAIGIGIAAKGRYSYQENVGSKYSPRMEEQNVNIRPFAAVPILVALVLLALSSTYKVSTGEAVIKVSPGGAYLATDAAPGYHTKAPWTKTESWDLRNNRVEFNDGGESDGGTIRTATSDPVDTWFDMTVTYDLQADGLREAFNQYRDQERLEKEQIVPAFSSQAKNAPGGYPATRIRGERPALSREIRGDQTDRLAKYGVNVSDVDLQAINLPTEVVNNLNKVQAAAAAAEAKRAELSSANIDAEKVRVAAKAESDADQITRCGATTTVETENVNGKPTQVTRIVPNPTCDPNRLNNSVLTARYIEMLRARSGDATFVLPPDASTLLNLGGAAPAAK